MSSEDSLILSKSKVSTIKRNVLKVLHKMIVYLLCQRTTGFDKIQRMECWLLSLFERKNMGEYANVAWVVAHWLKKKGKGSQSDSELVCGHLITRLAKRLKVFTEENMATYSAPTAYKTFDHVTLRDLVDDRGKLKPDIAGLVNVRPPPSPKKRKKVWLRELKLWKQNWS